MSGNIYAVKIFHEKGEQWQRCAKQNMEIVSPLDHPHIIQVHPRMTVPTTFPYIVMDHIQNGCLDPTLPNLDITNGVFRQLFEAVVYLHEKGIAHRDIKPENVLVKSLDPVHVVLTDFDFAMWDVPLAQWCGTYMYVAAEVIEMEGARAADGRFYTNKVDVWSLGVMLLEYSALNGLPRDEVPRGRHPPWKPWLTSLSRCLAGLKPGHQYLTDLASLMLVHEPAGRPEISYCLTFLNDMIADFTTIKRHMRDWVRIDTSHRPSISVCLNKIITYSGGDEQAVMRQYSRGSYHVEVDGNVEVNITVARAVSLIEDHFPLLNDAFQDMIGEELNDADLGEDDFESVTDESEGSSHVEK